MTTHAEDSLRSASIPQILDLPLAIATSETAGAEGLVAGQDGEVFDLVIARAATVGTIVAYERAVAKEQQVRIGIEESTASIASEAVDVPAVASYSSVSMYAELMDGQQRTSTYPTRKPCPPQESVARSVSIHKHAAIARELTSPQPLQG